MKFLKKIHNNRIANKNGIYKTLKFLLLVLIIQFSNHTQGQIFKRLNRTAERAVERTLSKKVDEKASQETEKHFDSTFNNKKSNEKDASQSESSYIQKTYTFTHKFVMQIQSDKHTSNIDYYLNKDANYIGSSMDLENNNTKMITVMDMTSKTATMFMEINNQKTQMSIPLDLENMTEESIEENDVKITATGNTKSILNFNCKEFKVTGKDYYGTIWVTNEAGVTFGKSFYKAKAKKGLNQSWMSMVNGLTMEMNITNTSKRKNINTIMKCIALEKSDLSIDGKIYKKML